MGQPPRWRGPEETLASSRLLHSSWVQAAVVLSVHLAGDMCTGARVGGGRGVAFPTCGLGQKWKTVLVFFCCVTIVPQIYWVLCLESPDYYPGVSWDVFSSENVTGEDSASRLNQVADRSTSWRFWN